MAHEWYSGVLNQSSWHGLESVESLPDAATLIRRGEETGAYPLAINLRDMRTTDGLEVPGKAVVASYLDGKQIAHSAVGDRYRPLDPREWRATIEAAVKVGAKPAGCFALRGGSRILATFEIPGGNDGTGLRNYFTIFDSMDGSLGHGAGGSTVRTVCANTLAAAMREGGFAFARHTASINDKAEDLRKAIEQHIKSGETVRELYKAAKETRLAKPDAEALFDTLFPRADKDATPQLATRLNNARVEAMRAMQRSENNEGPTVATLWNAATWVVDRTETGRAKKARGGSDMLDSMLFGSRGKRVEEIRALMVDVLMKDGTVKQMEAPEAVAHGIDHRQMGKQLLADLLG